MKSERAEGKPIVSTPIILALGAALVSGVMITLQGSLTNLSGQLIGPARTGLLINISGGLAGAIIVLALTLGGRGLAQWGLTSRSLLIVAGAGVLGILIISGVAYALPRIGLTAGQGAIILGQMVVAVLIDTRGWAGARPIPLDLRRVVGLIVMGVAAWLLLPRS